MSKSVRNFQSFIRWAKQQKAAKTYEVARQIEVCVCHLQAIRLNRPPHPLMLKFAASDFAKLEGMLR